MADIREQSNPSKDYFAITASDTVNFTRPTRGIYVGGAGNIVAVRTDDTTVTFNGAVAGSIIPIVAKRVNFTSTTATNLVGLV